MSMLHIQLWGNEAISKPRKVRDCCIDRLQHLKVPLFGNCRVCKDSSRDARFIGILEASWSPISRCDAEVCGQKEAIPR